MTKQYLIEKAKGMNKKLFFKKMNTKKMTVNFHNGRHTSSETSTISFKKA